MAYTGTPPPPLYREQGPVWLTILPIFYWEWYSRPGLTSDTANLVWQDPAGLTQCNCVLSPVWPKSSSVQVQAGLSPAQLESDLAQVWPTRPDQSTRDCLFWRGWSRCGQHSSGLVKDGLRKGAAPLLTPCLHVLRRAGWPQVIIALHIFCFAHWEEGWDAS